MQQEYFFRKGALNKLKIHTNLYFILLFFNKYVHVRDQVHYKNNILNNNINCHIK